MERRLGKHEVIAEDLGYVTDSVRQLVRDSGFPGMKVLEFAFDSRDSGSASDYFPHNFTETASHTRERTTMKLLWAGSRAFPAKTCKWCAIISATSILRKISSTNR